MVAIQGPGFSSFRAPRCSPAHPVHLGAHCAGHSFARLSSVRSKSGFDAQEVGS